MEQNLAKSPPATPTLKELTNALKSVSNWHLLGVNLELSGSELATIERDYRGDNIRCKTEMLSRWLENTKYPTWEAVVQALRLMEANAAADTIQRKYITSTATTGGTQNGGTNNGNAVPEAPGGVKGTQNGGTNNGNAENQRGAKGTLNGGMNNGNAKASRSVKGSRLSSTNGDRTFRFLDTHIMTEEEKQELEDRLLDDTESMIGKYARLVSSTNESLQKQKVNPKDIAVRVISLKLFDTYENQQRGLNDDGKKIQNASSIPDIFVVMSPYWSFFNYQPLEHIIEYKGTPEDKDNLQMYLDDLKKFCQRRTFEVPPHVYGNESNKENWAKFTLKLDDEIRKLDDVRKVQRRITKILGLQYLYLCDVTEGCVEVVFLIPQLVAQKVFPLSDAQQNALSANHVMENSCNLVHPQHYSEASNSKQENPAMSQAIRQPTKMAIGEALSSQESNAPLEQFPVLPLLSSSAGVDALPAKNNPPQQRVFGVQWPNPEVQLPPPQAHPHYRDPTPSPSHQEKAPWLPALHNEVEKEHHDNRFDQPNLSQLNYDVSTTSKNLRMDGSGSGSESDLSALLADQTQSPPQQGDQIQPPPFEAHPHYRHPTPYIPTPYHQEKAPRLLSLHDEEKEEHHDNQFDQPNQSQLDNDVTTTSKNLRMDGSGSGSESADADVNTLLADQTQSPPQQGVQQPNQIHPPPFEAHPRYCYPTPSPSHRKKAPRLLSLHDEVEEEHHDNRFDQPNPNQLNYDVSTTSKNLRMDGSGESAGVNALLADRTQSPPQQGVQQPNQEKAPRLLSPHVETEEEHHDDDQFDQPNQSQLDHDARNVRMDGSESGVNSPLANQTQSPPQPGVQQPNLEALSHHPYIPAPYHQEKAPQPVSPHMEAEEEPPDNQFDQPNQSQLDHDARNLRMDGSGSSESGQLTRPPNATPLTPSKPPTSPSVEELPSQPPTNLESAQMQSLSIEEEIKQFEERYANLVHSVLMSFQHGSVSFSDVQACLMALPISQQLQLGKLLQSKARQLFQTSSIKGLFLILSETPYWNFLNPSLLSHLVEQFGDGPTKQQKDKYLEELRVFRMRTKVSNFMDKWTGTSQPDTQELVVELEEEVWKQCNLEQLEQFRIGLLNMKLLEGSVLPWPFKVSSINAMFSLPKSIDGHNLELEDHQEFFLDHQVLRVSLNEVCILDLQVGCGDSGVEVVDHTDKLRDGATVQPEEEVESYREDGGEDHGKTDRGEQNRELTLGETDHSVSTPMVSQTAKELDQKQPSRDLSSMKHDKMEDNILRKLGLKQTAARETEQPVATTTRILLEEDGEGMMFSPKYGGLGARKDVMMIVSVGNKHLPGVRVEERVKDKARATRAFITYGKLPHNLITSLHISQETAADLKAISSLIQKDTTTRDVSLKLDIPDMQRPKVYYITAIANFLKQCRQPRAMIWYMGHSEEGTGNWCFKDGTISFQEIFDLYMTHSPGKLLTITSDCCYSGNWVHRCAETLDNKLGIPPCGHKARERGVLIKVYTSCQHDEKAAEPCFSTDGLYVDSNDVILIRCNQLAEHQTPKIADFTKLVCCRDPKKPCPAEDAFKNWKWDNAVSGEIPRKIYLVRGKHRGRPCWHYVLLSSGDEEYVQGFKAQLRTRTIDVADWGHRMVSGWGGDPPDNIRDKVDHWTRVCNWTHNCS